MGQYHGKEGFIPYTYCLPIERSVDDFVLPKSKKAYLTQSGLTGGHIKPQGTNLARTDSKSMPDITRHQQQQRQQPIGQTSQLSPDTMQSSQHNYVNQEPLYNNQVNRSRGSSRDRDYQNITTAQIHSRSVSNERYGQRSRDQTLSSSQDNNANRMRNRSQSHDRLHNQSHDSSRSCEPPHDYSINKSFSMSASFGSGESQPLLNHKSAPTTPDWNHNRRLIESPSHDYYNFIPPQLTKTVTQKAVIVKNNSTEKTHLTSSSKNQQQQQRLLGGSNPHLDIQVHNPQHPQQHKHRPGSNSTLSLHDANHSTNSSSPRGTYPYQQQTTSSSSYYKNPPQNKDTDQHNRSMGHISNPNQNRNPFYQPSASSTLPRNFQVSPSKQQQQHQTFQRTNSLHITTTSTAAPQPYHQRQNSLPAHYHNQPPQQHSRNNNPAGKPHQGINGHNKQEHQSTTSLFEKKSFGQYIVLFNYSPRQENDIAVERGEFVTLLNKDDDDWYWIRKSNRHEGFVPKTFLCPAEGQEGEKSI